jgi:hypothetical protein
VRERGNGREKGNGFQTKGTEVRERKQREKESDAWFKALSKRDKRIRKREDRKRETKGGCFFNSVGR